MLTGQRSGQGMEAFHLVQVNRRLPPSMDDQDKILSLPPAVLDDTARRPLKTVIFQNDGRCLVRAGEAVRASHRAGPGDEHRQAFGRKGRMNDRIVTVQRLTGGPFQGRGGALPRVRAVISRLVSQEPENLRGLLLGKPQRHPRGVKIAPPSLVGPKNGILPRMTVREG